MCLLVHSFSYWIVQLCLLAIMHENARLVAWGWLCIYILQIHCHALSCSLLQKTGVRQQQLVGQPEKVAGRPLFLVFNNKTWSAGVCRDQKWSATLPLDSQGGFSSFWSLVQVSENKWKQRQIGASHWISEEATEHASSLLPLRTSWFIAFLSCHA